VGLWKANEQATEISRITPMPMLLASAGIPKDTTHMSVIDKDGNMFDTTSSGGWISGCVILGETGIQMSSRGEAVLPRSGARQPRGTPGAPRVTP